MKLSNFQFDLPKSLLAQRPSEDRDESRLMVINRKEENPASALSSDGEPKNFKGFANYFSEFSDYFSAANENVLFCA